MKNRFMGQISTVLNKLKKEKELYYYLKIPEMLQYADAIGDYIVITNSFSTLIIEAKSAKYGKLAIDNITGEKKKHQLQKHIDLNKSKNIRHLYLIKFGHGRHIEYSMTFDMEIILKERKHKSYLSADDFNIRFTDLYDGLETLIDDST
jgi:hypothetical protein